MKTALSTDTVFQPAVDYAQRISYREYKADAGRWWERVTSSFVENGVEVTASMSDRLLTGLNAMQPDNSYLRGVSRRTVMGRTDESIVTVVPSQVLVRSITKAADSTRAGERVEVCGLLLAESSPRHTGVVARTYSPLRLPLSTSDPRTGATDKYTYAAGVPTRVAAHTGTGKNPATPDETYEYYPPNTMDAGRVKSITYADGTVRRFAYNPRGQVLREWGTAGYPAAYGYAATGEMTALWTFQGTPAGAEGWNAAAWPGNGQSASVTRWVYDAGTRLQLQKVISTAAVTYDGTAVSTAVAAGTANSMTYEYSPSGHLTAKINGRNQRATYAYTPWGQQQSVIWNGAAADPVYYDYRDSGRLLAITDASGRRTITQRADGQFLTETITAANAGQASDNYLAGAELSATYTAMNRRQTYTASLPGSSAVSATAYSPYGKLAEVQAAGRKVAFSYHAGTGRVQSRDNYTYNPADSTPVPTIPVMTAVEQLDNMGRITGVINTLSVGNVSTQYTEFDALDRRTKAVREDGNRWEYGYNPRGEVTAATKKNSAGNPLNGYQSAYLYDAIGNRQWADNGSGLFRTTYSGTNAANQYGSATFPAQFDVLGQRTSTTATVAFTMTGPTGGASNQTVNTNGLHWWSTITSPPQPTGGQGETGTRMFLNATEGAATLRSGTVIMPLDENTATNAPGLQVTFTYDGDGNLTYDGKWHYYWDAENRLASMSLLRDSLQNQAADQQGIYLEFAYDSQWRRIHKHVRHLSYDGSVETILSEERYLYDGWNPVGTWRFVQSAGWQLYQQYVWGPDVSQTAQGAGGVGGLLMVVDSATNDAWFPCYDGNGNVLAITAAKPSGTVEAQYDYDPFGQTLRTTGPAADLNPFRFSTKWTDESGLLYYGYRYYHPVLGRWVGRDPIGEAGGLGLRLLVPNSMERWHPSESP